MIKVLPAADALINVTNDAWVRPFDPPGTNTSRLPGCAPLEAGRYPGFGLPTMASRASSGPHGEIVARAPEFTPICTQVFGDATQGTHAVRELLATWLIVSLLHSGAGDWALAEES